MPHYLIRIVAFIVMLMSGYCAILVLQTAAELYAAVGWNAWYMPLAVLVIGFTYPIILLMRINQGDA